VPTDLGGLDMTRPLRPSTAVSVFTLALLLSVLTAPAVAEGTRSSRASERVGTVAHRGASERAPENTLAAIRKAIRADSDYVGIDVRRTRNDKLVLMHDKTLDRTTNVEKVYPRRDPWRVSQFSLREIRRLDAGNWWSSSYSGARVPSLADALRRLDKSRTGAFLEVKDPRAGTGRLVHRAIRRYTGWLRPGQRDRLVVQSFNRRWVRTYHRKHPGVQTSVLGDVAPGGMHRYSWADQVNMPYGDVLRRPRLVRAAHRHGLEVAVHTVNGRRTMRKVVRKGVDAVSTDRPGRLNDVLESSG
jgi:glycerophosphoryl diester phosphodiesterase